MRNRSVDDASCRRIPRQEDQSHSASQMESEKAVRHNQEKCAGVMERLRTSGIRPTIARIGVLQVIGAVAPGRICAEDVFRQMLLRGTRVSIGTVYRAIHQLEANGLVLREWDHSRTAYYRIKPSRFERPTHRIFCRTCSHSVAFTDADFLARLADVAQSQGILIVERDVTIQVDCAGCLGKPDDCRVPAHWSSPAEVLPNQSESCAAQP